MGNGAKVKDPRRRGSSVGPPRYPRKLRTIEHFGDVRLDPYYWLRERRNPQVRSLLQHENAYTESMYNACGGSRLCRELFTEMRARWKERDASLPYRDRSYWYYIRTVPNADYPIYCRRPFSKQTEQFAQEAAFLWGQDPNAPLPFYDDEVVYLDLNLFVKELRLDYVELGDMEVSLDEQRLALMLDCSNGKEVYTIFIIQIKDVNYAKWLQGPSSDMHRTWAAAMLRSDQSIYTSPVSCLMAKRGLKTAVKKGRKMVSCNGTASVPLVSPPPPPSPPPPSITTTTTTGISGVPAAKKNGTTIIPARQVEPVHEITRQIDVFDAADEVLWLSSTTLLYLGLDEKMRSCRVVYHDLTLPVGFEDADIVCYEEPDEKFWVSSLCFSADERFVTFTVASGSFAEVYVIPCNPGFKRCVTGVPLVVDSELNKHEECDSGAYADVNINNKCEVYCFAERSFHRDYDIDHHDSLFAEDVGAWVVVVTNPLSGREYFPVAYVLDTEVLCNKEKRGCRTLSTPSLWHPLFAYDSHISVEGVECMRDYLLVSVLRAASSTVLLLPVRTLWARWRNRDGNHISPLSLRDDMIDLRHVACKPLRTLGAARFSLTELLTYQRQLENDNKEEKAEFVGGCNWNNKYMFSVTQSVEDVSFNTLTWRIIVTHMTIPTVVIACTLQETDDMLCVKWLCDAVVSGEPYVADDYDASILWVPSDYAFCENSPSPQSMLPTKKPAAVVLVPVYVCWKKALRRHGENPMFLTVYGSYGDCCDVSFETERLSLLDRGFIWAAAAVRGGGEFGIPWREAGRRLQRATSVNDFVSVSCYVQDTGWCAAGRLVTYASSAGGFVATAAMCVAPSLLRALIASVPFVDCLTTLLDADLPLTPCEWDEFGNPLDEPDAYHLLRAMSPMDNIPPAGVALPHILLLSGWHDTRVGFWEPLAFTARLRERERTAPAATGRIVLHHCDFGAGHSGASGRYDKLREIAREYAFAILVQEVQTEDESNDKNT